MKEIFDGYSPANTFAQEEALKKNKKTYLFKIKQGGVKYCVADTIGSKSVNGKLMREYGEDVPVKPVRPTPSPKASLPEHPIVEEPKEETE